jgi:hypothetical protein
VPIPQKRPNNTTNDRDYKRQHLSHHALPGLQAERPDDTPPEMRMRAGLMSLTGLFWDGSVDIGNYERRSRHPVVMGARTFVFCGHNFCPAVFLACDLTGQG